MVELILILVLYMCYLLLQRNLPVHIRQYIFFLLHQSSQPEECNLIRKVVLAGPLPVNIRSRTVQTTAEGVLVGFSGSIAHKADIGDQFHCRLEIFVRFPGETNNEVRRNRNVRPNLPQFAYLLLIFECRVAAFHARKNPVRAVLHRQVQEIRQFGNLRIRLDQAVGEFTRMRGRKTNAGVPPRGQDPEIGEMLLTG